jgi:hypothetical protein
MYCRASSQYIFYRTYDAHGENVTSLNCLAVVLSRKSTFKWGSKPRYTYRPQRHYPTVIYRAGFLSILVAVLES